MKRVTQRSLRSVPLAVYLSLVLVADHARAAVQGWEPNGTASIGGDGTWDTTNAFWTPAGTQTQVDSSQLVPFTAGNAALFCAGPSDSLSQGSFTITVVGNPTIGGIFNGLLNPGPCTLTITNGQLTLAPGTCAFGIYSSVGDTTTIWTPIGGSGVLNPQSSGSLFLYGANTYTGGTLLSAGGLQYFNNDSAFGTGTISIQRGSGLFAILWAQGGTTRTLANDFANNTSGGGINFVMDTNTPVVCTGAWSLGANNLEIRNAGSTLRLNGVISGTANLTLSANSGGTTVLAGANTYSGQTLISSGNSGSTVSVSSLNSVSGGSASSSLGHPTTVANGTIAIGSGSLTSTLIYTGAGESSDRVINLAGATGGATLQADGSGPVTFSSALTATGTGSKTLTLQGANPGLNTLSGAIVDNSSANATALVKAGAGTWRLSGVNAYTGGTTVSNGTLEIAGSVKGNVSVQGGVLQLDSATALAGTSSAAVALAGSLPNGSVKLNFTGSQNINSLTIGGVAQPAGTYGASGANHNNPVFAGAGLLNVLGAPYIVAQPQSVVAWPDAPVSFSVTALGSPTYQWKRNGANIPGANASSYAFAAEAANAGTYTCWLTNAIGWTNTTDAILTIRSTNAYTSLVLADNPISWWRLDEATGAIAYDAVGTNNGTYVNVILNKTPGYSSLDPDACVNLQKMPVGQGSFVSVANYQAFNFFANPDPQFTLEGWAYFTNISGVQRLFSTDQISAPGGYMFGISGANQLVFTTSGYQDYYMPATGSLPSPLQANVWYHLAVGCDGSYLYFYVNGQNVGTALLAALHGGVSGVPMCLGANGNFLSINGTRDNSEQLKGYLDECAIYGTFLGDSEILAHYDAAQPSVPLAQTPVADQPTNYTTLTTTLTESASGQVLHYQWFRNGSPVGADSSTLTLANLQSGDAGTYTVRVNNGAGGSTNPPGVAISVLPVPTTAAQVGLTNDLVLHLPFDTDYKDISGHKNNGTNVNATTLNTDSPIVGGGYLHYSSSVGGPYNYVTLGKPSDLVFGPAGSFSVAFWVRQSDVYTNLPFFGNATNSTGRNLGFALAPGLSSSIPVVPNGSWAWSFFDGTTQDYATGPDLAISDGNWHHLTFVFDRTANAIVYLDGVLVSSVNDSYLGGVDSGAPFNIGQDPTGMFDAEAQADIDDIGVWRRPLTQFEVSGMYLAGSKNTPGVSFAPVITATPPGPVQITGISGTSLTYTGGSGSQFVLVKSTTANAALSTWSRVATNSATPGSFTIPAVGLAAPAFYSVKSE